MECDKTGTYGMLIKSSNQFLVCRPKRPPGSQIKKTRQGVWSESNGILDQTFDNLRYSWIRDPHTNCMDEAQDFQWELGRQKVGKFELLLKSHVDESACNCGVQNYRCGWCR